ncbi:MAG TPA: insulinase family protein [Caldithrix abyssi]|uniref:Insulinase family protein n=1 Tax=Caldithrix abyssi TaxID=187145 RepID=A0A7V4U3M5_CALAY|nr:insulinase family protein [Caldithrix abyssi]
MYKAFLSALIFLISGFSFAAEKSSLPALPPAVSIFQLDNGMQVLLIENPALPMVGVNVVVKVGSAYESFASSGMSHMLEHLLFNGTTSRTQKELYDDVDRIGGYNNANTDRYYTNYMMVTPADQIKTGMEIQADMLFHSTLPEEKFDKEKGIVLEEIAKSLADPREQQERNTISILYQGHALSLPTLGTYATIEGMKRDDVYSFYKNNYVPNNMILSVIGNFDSAKMRGWIEEIYGKVAPGVVKREQSEELKTGFDTNGLKTPQSGYAYYRFYDGKNIRLQLLFPLPSSFNEAHYDLMDVILKKANEDWESALKKQFSEQIQSLQASTRVSPLRSYIELSCLVDPNADINAITDFLDKKLRSFKFSLSQEALIAEINKKRTAFLRNIEKPHMFGIYNAHKFAVNGIEAVLRSYDKSGYLKAAKELSDFSETRAPVVIVQKPEKRTGGKKQQEVVTKYFPAKNGTADIIAVQNPASNLLAIHFLVKHKAYYESQFGKDAAKVLHECIKIRLMSDENQKISNRFGLTYVVNDNPFIPMDDIYLHPDFGYIRVEGLADEMPEAIAFLTEQLNGFVPSEEEFTRAQNKLRRFAPMMMGGKKVKKQFQKTYKAIVYEDSPYQSAGELTYDNLVAFARAYFQPSNMIISVVSPTDVEKTAAFFSNFAGGTEINEPVYRLTLKKPQEPVTKDENGGGEQAYLFWGFVRDIDPQDKPALTALSRVLADRIVFDIREKQGMAYRMSAGIEIKDKRALFYVNMGTRPQNADKLIPQYPKFFKESYIADLSAEELEKTINMYLGRMMFRRLSSINRAYYLGHSLYFHNDIFYDKKFLDALKEVDVDAVKAAARKYLKADNPVLVVFR